ncbi:MAG: ChbG/HpnK family deacetylase [Erysipelotrichaceae bacterium]|nr:ChbG/HpnK family deacetylase [Erysipelotrichaceae bacterium]
MKRLVYRADDIGYTLAFDLGAFKGMDEGIITSADVMLDSPHTEEALLWLKKRPWISVGWHRHLWESPVAPAEKIPHMVNEQGRFIWGHRHQELMKQVPYEEAYTEFRAEVERCIAVLGKAPDTASVRLNGSELEDAFRDICDEYGIIYGYYYADFMGRKMEPKEEYRHLNYRHSTPFPEGITGRDLYDLSFFPKYNPEELIMNIRWDDENVIYQTGGHPGYLDDHILAESACTIHRPKELLAALSEKVKQWIIDNHVVLINQLDVIYGTNEYQKHLKAINSPLWAGNFKEDVKL